MFWTDPTQSHVPLLGFFPPSTENNHLLLQDSAGQLPTSDLVSQRFLECSLRCRVVGTEFIWDVGVEEIGGAKNAWCHILCPSSRVALLGPSECLAVAQGCLRGPFRCASGLPQTALPASLCSWDVSTRETVSRHESDYDISASIIVLGLGDCGRWMSSPSCCFF